MLVYIQAIKQCTMEKFMSVISSENVNAIIRKTLGYINKNIIEHGETTGYIVYKMLEYDNTYTDQDLVDYTIVAILHDIGLYREEGIWDLKNFESRNPWVHSVYGFLFLKYLSPVGNKAEIILYHHLDYKRYSKIKSKYLHIIGYLNLADKIDIYRRSAKNESIQDYFETFRDIKYSKSALDTFFQAEKKYNIISNISDQSYKAEMTDLFRKKVFNEPYKKNFLEMLVYTIVFRSEHTVIHTISTVSFAVQLGRQMHLSTMELSYLYYGALLHDIGKLAIPHSILESNRRLSEKEMTIMREHVRITEMILEGSIAEEVVQIAVRHHEKQDGTGYPKGLTETNLTLPQQIVALADILSALYERRSYKNAYDTDLIQKILKEEAQNHKISKSVVECLLKNYDSIISKIEVEKESTLGLYYKIKKQFAIIIAKLK